MPAAAGRGDAAPGDADVLQDRTDLAEVSLNTTRQDADTAQEEYVKSLVIRSDPTQVVCSR